MKLKTVVAASMPQAMAQIRELLGEDAIILASETDPEDGRIRVTAALEDDPMDSPVGQSGGDSLRHAERIRAALRFHRVPDGLLERLSAQAGGIAGETATLALAGALDSELRFGEAGLTGGRQVLLLAGPPGAGKTATAAKLCARAKIAGLNPALIAMADDKAGGREQIATFAEALDVPLHEAEDANAMRSAALALGEAELTIVDTPGIDPFDPRAVARIAARAAAAGAGIVLVLPAGQDAAESAETALVFAETGALGLVATKIDVTRRLGGLLSAAQAGGLALLAGGVAPTIADGLTTLNPLALARLLLPPDQAPEQLGQAAPALATGTLP